MEDIHYEILAAIILTVFFSLGAVLWLKKKYPQQSIRESLSKSPRVMVVPAVFLGSLFTKILISFLNLYFPDRSLIIPFVVFVGFLVILLGFLISRVIKKHLSIQEVLLFVILFGFILGLILVNRNPFAG